MRVAATQLRSMGFNDAEFFVGDVRESTPGMMLEGRAWLLGHGTERGLFVKERVALSLDSAVEMLAARIREQRDLAGES